MLHIIVPGLTYFVTASFYLLTTFTHFAHHTSPPLVTINLFSVSMSSVVIVWLFFVLDSTYK